MGKALSCLPQVDAQIVTVKVFFESRTMLEGAVYRVVIENATLPVGESNPDLPRDRRRYCPLY